MRGTSARTQPRGEKGRFVKRTPALFPMGEQTWVKDQPLEDLDGWGPKTSELIVVRQPSRWSNFTRLVSHHRIAIIGYTLYLIVCLLAGAIGGYLGVRVGLG